VSLFTELCRKMYMTQRDLAEFLAKAPYRYKVYSIPKRNGKGSRTIAQPSKELKFVQRLFVDNFLSKFPVHSSAMGYREGISIKDNAYAHVRSRYLLKMDFKDFFPSITPELLFYVLEFNDISLATEDKYLLSRLLFYKSKVKGSKLVLSIGAPSSPILSNIIMYLFDLEMSAYCSDLNISYTRYADDITFSCNERGVLYSVPDVVETMLQHTTLGCVEVNASKTIFSSKRNNRHVTGIVLSNDGKLSLGRDKKRLISAMVHRFKSSSISEEEVVRLRGYLAFCQYIEPLFILRLREKYGVDVMGMLIK